MSTADGDGSDGGIALSRLGRFMFVDTAATFVGVAAAVDVVVDFEGGIDPNKPDMIED